MIGRAEHPRRVPERWRPVDAGERVDDPRGPVFASRCQALAVGGKADRIGPPPMNGERREHFTAAELPAVDRPIVGGRDDQVAISRECQAVDAAGDPGEATPLPQRGGVD